MIRVRAPSRLHFGLLSLPRDSHWPAIAGAAGLPARQFGGVGLMVEAPGLELTLEPAAHWSVEGRLAERALTYARRVAVALGPALVQPQHLRVDSAPPEHVGLGTGTQLGMAVALGLTQVVGKQEVTAEQLAHLAGRGARSALGAHGFVQGGFLIEGGKRRPDQLAPLVARAPFPEDWRVVLVLTRWGIGLHGSEESEAFQRLQSQHLDLSTTDTLCRLVLLGMLPALAERDLDTFGEALYELNVRVGQAFASVQGGTYADPRIAGLVAWIRNQGVRGVGQSSWGPAVFAIVHDQERAQDLAVRLRESFGLEAKQVEVTAACNGGATVVGP
jgi:beta-RFAP synthase